ncbi:MAG: CHASE2 domain-containing protein, partial [Gemmatimonadaceae bacterium]|nr:CHASE2 domain-containing protein [Chitinophagaceae bacterium]
MSTNRRNIPQYLLLSTVSLVLCIILFSIFPSLARFQFTDFYYSRFMKSATAPDITIVNIENRHRHEIAQMIEKLEAGGPAVIGLDVIFPPRQDS